MGHHAVCQGWRHGGINFIDAAETRAHVALREAGRVDRLQTILTAETCDGKLTAADAAFGQFKVMVTKADGSTGSKTLAELGITEINLEGDATGITLPDGSRITAQTTFTRSNGSTGTVADTVLVAEEQGHRVKPPVPDDVIKLSQSEQAGVFWPVTVPVTARARPRTRRNRNYSRGLRAPPLKGVQAGTAPDFDPIHWINPSHHPGSPRACGS